MHCCNRGLFGRGIRGGVARRAVRLLSGCLLVLVGAVAPVFAYEDLDTLLDLDPELYIPPYAQAFEDQVKVLWVAALEAPEADIRRRAAESFVRAQREGYEGLEDAIPGLTVLLEKPDPHPAVRLAAARALCALGARDAAPLLRQEAEREGLHAALMIEPRLAEWQYQPMLEVWRKRLTDAKTARRYTILALECLGVMQDAPSEETLRQWVRDTARPVDIRLTAARALAQVRPAGLVDLAKELAAGNAPAFERTLAAALLGEHRDEQSVEFLLTLAVDKEPAVADLALGQLFEVASQRIRPLAEQLLANADVNVRRWAMKAIAQEPNANHLLMLKQRLVDPHPELRVVAREALLQFATEGGLHEEVIAAAVDILGGDDWRGLEQSARIVAVLDHKPAASRLIELLTQPRDEVGITAAWGVRKLSVPETLDPALDYCERAFAQLRRNELQPLPGDLGPRMSQLIQHFGVHRFAKADDLMRRLVPKQALSSEARGAAIWSLSYLYENELPDDLCRQFAERIADVGSTPPEIPRVRQMSAVALGRLKYQPGLPTLRKFYELEGSNSSVGYACGWAIEQLTGEKVSPPETLEKYPQGLFLQPYRE